MMNSTTSLSSCTGKTNHCISGSTHNEEATMGLMSKLFGGSKIEGNLRETYISFYRSMGFPHKEATETAEQLLARAKEKSKQCKTDNMPENSGDFLLANESSDENIRATLDEKRKEGVTNDDLRWWWNMHDLERRMMLEFDELNKLLAHGEKKQSGLSDEEAAAEAMRVFPVYGEHDDPSHTSEENRPLPFELKDRVNLYVEKRSSDDLYLFRADVAQYKTFNAFVRDQIAKGNL
jgi:hypothetical protein